jgi:hypothetical protein
MNTSLGNMSINSSNNESGHQANQNMTIKELLKKSTNENETLAEHSIKFLTKLKVDLMEKYKNKSGINLDSKKTKKFLTDLMDGIIQTMDDNNLSELNIIDSAINAFKH